MNIFLNIKLIVRNWWRNKLFFLISLFSLTAGLGCTNLLMTFFIHEYNVEKYNTDRNLIYLLRQDSPMEEGIKVAYSTSDAATQIKEKYAEITDILHVNGMSGNLCKYNGTRSHTDGFQRNNAKCLDEKGISRFVPHSSI